MSAHCKYCDVQIFDEMGSHGEQLENSEWSCYYSDCREKMIEKYNRKDFWSKWVYPQGCNPEDIQNELMDYHDYMIETSKVYMYFTSNNIFKVNTKAENVINEIERFWEMRDEMNKILDDLYHKVNSKTILVIAGNYQEFKLFCNQTILDYEKNNNLEFEGVEFIYYNGIGGVRGFRFDDFIKYGTWYRRTDINLENDIYPSMKPDYWAKNDKLWLIMG